MAAPRYEIDIGDDGMDEAGSSLESPPANNERVVLKSAVTKRKGRGFSNVSGGFGEVSGFDVLLEQQDNQNLSQAQRSIEGWTIFVTNLHEECTEDDLADGFADFGAIKDLRMPLDHRTGYVKGYAIIEFASYKEAKAAIDGMNGVGEIMGQVVQCDFAFVRGPSTGQQYGSTTSSLNHHLDDGLQIDSSGDARDLLSRKPRIVNRVD